MRRLRVSHRPSKASPDGQHVWSLGIRLGYWPCLRAPFVSIDLGPHRVDIWHGLPSYGGPAS